MREKREGEIGERRERYDIEKRGGGRKRREIYEII